ncbi:hypothetical protein [Campylobacter sp.]|nr:hypothetical protein [Campylobacter sp.]MDY3246352.1 hypothetical protein [Campylobacter sp.]MDY4803769.1 hypothetical protein [Campylobacter sp.]
MKNLFEKYKDFCRNNSDKLYFAAMSLIVGIILWQDYQLNKF